MQLGYNNSHLASRSLHFRAIKVPTEKKMDIVQHIFIYHLSISLSLQILTEEMNAVIFEGDELAFR